MSDSIQPVIEKLRAKYDGLPRPLLAHIASVHKISVRKFADIFGISKSYAEEILNHRTMPTLELAVRIARYWECSVEELFGWRVDDDGSRRPLLVQVDGKPTRLSIKKRKHDAIPLAVNQ